MIDGKGYSECSSFTRPAVHMNITIVRLSEIFDNREAKAGTFLTGGAFTIFKCALRI